MRTILKIALALCVGFGAFFATKGVIEYTAVQTKKVLVPYNAILTNGNNLYPYIIRLEHPTFGFFCTGFVIDGNYAITAAHCITNELGLLNDIQINVTSVYGTTTGTVAKPVAVDKYRDVGFIEGNFLDFTSASVDFTGEKIQLGMPMKACGYPSGQINIFCMDMHLTGNMFFRYRATGGPVFKGQSGGPVTNSEGIVVGVNSAVDYSNVVIGPLVGVLEVVGLR